MPGAQIPGARYNQLLLMGLSIWWLTACARPPALDHCGDSLTGVWRADGRAQATTTPSGEPWAFHIYDHGTHVEVYPRFDDSFAPTGSALAQDQNAKYAPGWFHIKRIGRNLVGERIARASRANVSCALTAQAAIRNCRGRQLELSWTTVVSIDWRTCSSTTATRVTRVHLTRH